MFARVRLGAPTQPSVMRAAKPALERANEYFAPEQETAETCNPAKFSWSFGTVAASAPSDAGAPPGADGNGENHVARPRVPPPLLMQAKLEIGAADDPLEREADHVAEQAVRMPRASAPPTIAGAVPALPRKCSCGGKGDTRKSERSDDERCTVWRKVAEAQVSSRGGGQIGTGLTAPPIVYDVLRSSGQLLDDATRALFEPTFGALVSQVRLHADQMANRSAGAMNAYAYTVGNNIVFAAGRFSPGTQEGRRLLAHELTHVVQQGGTATAVQRQPAPPDPNDEREVAVAEAETAGECSAADIERQVDEEIRLKLDSHRKRDTHYALMHGAKDKRQMEKHGLSLEQKREIAVKWHFFEGPGKAAYIRSISATLSNYPDEATEIMEPCLATKDAGQETEQGIGPGENAPQLNCDINQKQFPLFYEGEPEKAKCLDVINDPEYRNNFDANIVSAAGYAIERTTWENVAYDRFKVMVVKYKNGRSEYFLLDDLGDFHYGETALGITHYGYFKRKETDLIYPIANQRIYFKQALTPRILSFKNGLKYQIEELQRLYTLLQVGGVFAQIVALNSITEDFKATIKGFRRSEGLAGSRGKSRRGRTGSGVDISTGIPEPTENEPTGRIRPEENVSEKPPFRISAEKRLNGNTYEVDVYGLYREGGRPGGLDPEKKSDIRPIMNVLRGFINEAKALGAKQIKITGKAVGNPNIKALKGIRRVALSMGGTALRTAEDEIEVVIPIR